MGFKLWLEADYVKWNMEWPVRQGTGDEPHSQDTPPHMENGDYVLYHGTHLLSAENILHTHRINHDDWHCVGVCTTPSAAQTYASMKAKTYKSAVLRVVVRREWLTQQEITREVGGGGKDQWLIRVDCMPPEAMRDIRIYSISGEPV